MTENGTILPPEETPKQDDSCRAEPAPRAQAGSPADVKRSRYLGCLLGGAVGDALGYPVEFQKEKTIRAQYGPDGIRALEQAGSPAPVSDDTQMTLFAAASLVYAARNGRGVRESLWLGYREWLGTQGDTSRMETQKIPPCGSSATSGSTGRARRETHVCRPSAPAAAAAASTAGRTTARAAAR